VAEAFGYDVGPDVGGQELGRVGVAEIVKADHRQAEGRRVTAHEITPPLAQAVGFDGGAVDLAEDEAVVAPTLANREATF
jgi:hypothetical protein